VRPAVLFGALCVLLFPYYRARGWTNVSSVREEAPLNRSVVEQLRELHRTVPRGARLLFLNDPINPAWENLVFLTQLAYGDNTIKVDRLKRLPRRPDDNELASYNYVFDYEGGRFLELHRPWRREAVPMIVNTPQGPEIYHSDWAPVTTASPARPGENLITRAMNLGPTQPPAGSGHPFPPGPFANLVSPLRAKVAGIPAEITAGFGWPGEINIYRFDFRVPPSTPAGMAAVEWSIGEVAGIPVKIPVRR
jgi:hypothetical protein